MKSVNKQAKPKTLSGLFITFEGGEGAGKSSQMKLLAERLTQQGYEVVSTREPGGSQGGEAVRHVLLSGAAESLGSDMEAILFSASRSDHVDTLIAPALATGKVVLCDRFIDSTRVYQGVEGKVSDDLLQMLEKIACGNVWPDLTIIIDLDPGEGMKRADQRRNKQEVPDRFEKETLSAQKARRRAFLAIAKAESDRCRVIDGSGTPNEVAKLIWKQVALAVGAKEGLKKKPARKSKLVSHKKLTQKKSTAKAASDKSKSKTSGK